MHPIGVSAFEMSIGRGNRVIEFSLLLLFHCIVLSEASAQSSNERLSVIPSYLYNYTGRFFAISKKQPLRSILRSHDAFILGTSVVQGYFAAIEKETLMRGPNGTSGSKLLQPCNSNGEAFGNLFRAHNMVRNLPLPANSCMSEYIIDEGTSREMSIPLSTLVTALRNRSRVLHARREMAVKDTVISSPVPIAGSFGFEMDWNDPDVGMDFPYEDDVVKCRINNAGGVRRGLKWYVQTTLTNRPVRQHVRDFERLYLMEYHRLSDNRSFPDLDHALEMGIEVFPREGNKGPVVHTWGTTTILIASKGSMPPNAFERSITESIPSLLAATNLASHPAQQVSDAIALSSISILFLPLLLNVVPLAAISPHTTSTKAAILYTIATDILSVFPLLAKGIELIYLSTRRYRVAGVRITSDVNVTNLPESSVVELWTTECWLPTNTRTWGILFTVFGLTFMIGGIILEWSVRQSHLSRQMNVYDEDPNHSTLEILSESGMYCGRSPVTSDHLTIGSRSPVRVRVSTFMNKQGSMNDSGPLHSAGVEYMSPAQHQYTLGPSQSKAHVSNEARELTQPVLGFPFEATTADHNLGYKRRYENG